MNDKTTTIIRRRDIENKICSFFNDFNLSCVEVYYELDYNGRIHFGRMRYVNKDNQYVKIPRHDYYVMDYLLSFYLYTNYVYTNPYNDEKSIEPLSYNGKGINVGEYGIIHIYMDGNTIKYRLGRPDKSGRSDRHHILEYELCVLFPRNKIDINDLNILLFYFHKGKSINIIYEDILLFYDKDNDDKLYNATRDILIESSLVNWKDNIILTKDAIDTIINILIKYIKPMTQISNEAIDILYDSNVIYSISGPYYICFHLYDDNHVKRYDVGKYKDITITCSHYVLTKHPIKMTYKQGNHHIALLFGQQLNKYKLSSLRK